MDRENSPFVAYPILEHGLLSLPHGTSANQAIARRRGTCRRYVVEGRASLLVRLLWDSDTTKTSIRRLPANDASYTRPCDPKSASRWKTYHPGLSPMQSCQRDHVLTGISQERPLRGLQAQQTPKPMVPSRTMGGRRYCCPQMLRPTLDDTAGWQANNLGEYHVYSRSYSMKPVRRATRS